MTSDHRVWVRFLRGAPNFLKTIVIGFVGLGGLILGAYLGWAMFNIPIVGNIAWPFVLIGLVWGFGKVLRAMWKIKDEF